MERRLLLEKLMVTMPQLDAPTISLSSDTLSIEEVEDAEYYDIYDGDTLVESVPAVSFNNIYICGQKNYSFGFYKVNNGESTEIPQANYVSSLATFAQIQAASIHLTNVFKLEVLGTGADVCDATIYDSNGTQIYQSGDIKQDFVNITEHLEEGCYVVVYTAD